MAERRAAFVHDFSLALRIEVLREHTHDAQDLALPFVELGRVLLEEVEQVLLRQTERLALLEVGARFGIGR
jgi:hypothetical protein